MRVNGPGAALTYHLTMHEKVRRSLDAVQDGRLNMKLVTTTFDQRSALMTSINTFAVDGDSVAMHRSRPTETLSLDNLVNTVYQLQNEYETLNEGETLYVSHHVSETVAAAAASAESEPLFPTDLLSPAGLLVLEQPILLDDLHPDTGEVEPGLQMPVRAVAWRQTKVAVGNANVNTGENAPGYRMVDGVHMTLYTDGDAFKEHYVNGYREMFPERGDEIAQMVHNADLMESWASDITAWAYGEPWKEGVFHPDAAEDNPGVIIGSHSYMRRWFLSLMRWSWGRILVPETYVPTKPEKKRWLRKFDDEPTIKVLRLRRVVEAEKRAREAGEEYVMDHRVLVRGFWRRQHYPSLGAARNADGTFNNESHRLIWIDEHIRGPETGPLKVGHRVTAAVR